VAKYCKAEVTAVCGPSGNELVKSLGAHHVIDYTKENFTQSGKKYDIVLATAGSRSIFDYKKMLKNNGRYIVTGGSMPQIFQGMLLGPLFSLFSRQHLCSFTVKVNKDLDRVKALIEQGQITPVIDRVYPFDEIANALTHYDTGRAKGKIIVSMA
jgi:NADPH:quinone reductase-like Zn-dependent oxidoreductase